MRNSNSILNGIGKTRYGICINFYRPVERNVPASSSSIRDSWRQSAHRSSDSAFSRYFTLVNVLINHVETKNMLLIPSVINGAR